ncbi:MAG: recombination protein O N-terminal domain-containing protein [Candidatus Azambacteria bacterium]|nr:recombination protein O N-terminal domain-containing protein [Candidatus Azambacteria bacterium]
MATYQTKAIVLKREDIFEADRLYHLYTEEFGKVRALAGGVRKSKAKLTGHLEPFNFIWVELMTKKNGDLFITTALSEINLLPKNYLPNQISLFTKISDFALQMLRGQEKDEEMWNFILGSFVKAGVVENGADQFFEDYKSGFSKIMGFGGNLEEADYYLNDFMLL